MNSPKIFVRFRFRIDINWDRCFFTFRSPSRFYFRFCFRNSEGNIFGDKIVSLRFNFCINGICMGAQNWTQTFFLIRGPQNPGISCQKVWFPWVSKDIPNFLAPTPTRAKPPPHPKISGPKSLGLGSFFLPDLKDFLGIILARAGKLLRFVALFPFWSSFQSWRRWCRLLWPPLHEPGPGGGGAGDQKAWPLRLGQSGRKRGLFSSKLSTRLWKSGVAPGSAGAGSSSTTSYAREREKEKERKKESK